MYELPFGLTPYFSYAQSFNPQYLANCVPACDPYQGAQYEVGFKYRPTKQFAINGAIFDITEQNRLTYGDGEIPKAIGEARTRGAEIEFVGALTSYLDIIAGYSYTDSKVTKGDEAGKHVPTVPLHQASLWGKYKFSMFGLEGFSAGAGVRYIGDSWGGEGHREDTRRDAVGRHGRLGEQALALSGQCHQPRGQGVLRDLPRSRRLLLWNRPDRLQQPDLQVLSVRSQSATRSARSANCVHARSGCVRTRRSAARCAALLSLAARPSGSRARA